MNDSPLILAALGPPAVLGALPPGARWRRGDEPVDGWVVFGSSGLAAVPAGEPALVIADGEPPATRSPSLTIAASGGWLPSSIAVWCAALRRERELRRALRHDLYGRLAVAAGHLDLLEEPALGPLSERQRASVTAARRAIASLTDDLRALADRAVADR